MVERRLVLLLALAALPAFGCDETSQPAHAQAPAADPARLVDEGATLLDVRTPAEFARGHVQGAVNLPVQELEARVAELDASKPVVVYCRRGNRSATAARILSARGFEVTDVGAMSDWPRPDEIVR